MAEASLDVHKRIEDELREMREILSVAQVVVSSLDLDEVLNVILSGAMAIMQTPAGSIALYDESISSVHLRVHSGLSDKFATKNRWLVKQGGLTHHILEEGELFVVEDTEKADFFKNPIAIGEGIRSLIAVPLKIQDQIVGILYVDDFKPRQFLDHRLRALNILASFASMSINNAQLHAETKKLACTDGLTGLYNHRQFKQMSKEELARAKRYKKKMSMIMFDIDNFKLFNDQYGHPAGDKVISAIGCLMKQTLRDCDYAFRYGGEEFVAILPETGITSAVTVATRIAEAIRENSHLFLADIAPEHKVTVSMGVTAYPRDGEDEVTLLHVVDDMLYKAKALGKDRVCFQKKITK
jgi:diguanylate cyclase (GGDEF)-like protein